MTIRLEVYGTDGRRFEMHHADGFYDVSSDALNATREALGDAEVSRVVLAHGSYDTLSESVVTVSDLRRRLGRWVPWPFGDGCGWFEPPRRRP